ncbi:hypothetical protein GGS21DRAFT_536350 [Xylaria nigripes]|nr:hypothetical protein GGS21DRAFT_536350 [Xylaria nigripes]
MSSTPVWVPARRLPRPSTTQPLARVDHENHLDELNLQPSRFHGTLSPSRPRDISNQYPSIYSNTPGTRNYDSAPIGNLKGNNLGASVHPPFWNNVAYEQHSFASANDDRRSNDNSTNSLCEVGGCIHNHYARTIYCRAHKCCAERCGNIREIGSQFCLTHKCLSCERLAGAGKYYCETHKCHMETCVRGKAEGRELCKHHSCRWEDCTQTPKMGACYCYDHACAAGDCTAKVLGVYGRLGNYCCCHTCSKEGCLLRASPVGPFCVEHECSMRGCPNPKIWDDERIPGTEHDCCRFHTCIQSGCYAPTAQVGTLCDRHRQLHSAGRDNGDCINRHKTLR